MQPIDFNSQYNQGNNSLEIRRGQFFQFASPSGWQIAEDGQFAIVQRAPDNRAMTILVGNSGLPPGYPPAQFIYEKLVSTFGQLSLGNPRPEQPVPGCAYAWEFDYAYAFNGMPCRGVARCSVAPTYGMCLMVMTCAASLESQWAGYAPWLPVVARQVEATNGAAFGMRGIMQQNIQHSQEWGEAVRRYNDWSGQLWGDVRRQRDQVDERINHGRREGLGGVATFVNPYDSRLVEMPLNYSYHWVNRQGQVWSTNDPSADPNMGSNESWSRMNRYGP